MSMTSYMESFEEHSTPGLLLPAGTSTLSTSPEAPVRRRVSNTSHRWDRTKDALVLLSVIEAHFNGDVPAGAFNLTRLGVLMPVREEGKVWEGSKLRKKAIELLKENKSSKL
eukprot:Plantae.Rhodophyta-Palmaria_palmata.ctg27285.p2 GENE.Plantae.Rhodophyta-Palmaria_palmata.ctg27285~~Plantae.Rhodophyta-Palmaria_palmata.ctg27285.p2  ORF type:complete len:112 (-),score=9.11 Plantae.Rhodophyta-Palmaria_palmata.ctg27285:55-390(-)